MSVTNKKYLWLVLSCIAGLILASSLVLLNLRKAPKPHWQKNELTAEQVKEQGEWIRKWSYVHNGLEAKPIDLVEGGLHLADRWIDDPNDSDRRIYVFQSSGRFSDEDPNIRVSYEVVISKSKRSVISAAANHPMF